MSFSVNRPFGSAQIVSFSPVSTTGKPKRYEYARITIALVSFILFLVTATIASAPQTANDEVNKLKGEPSAKKIAIVHSASYRTSFSYSALSHTYAMQMYNSSKKATENTVDELTGEQLTFENVVVCFADMDAYAGDSHDVQEVQYIKGGDAYLFTRGGVQVGRWEKTYPTNPLKLYTKSGEEMTLNRGKTYFALVDNDELSNFSYQ